MNVYAQIFVLTAHLWHPAVLPVSPPIVGMFQRMTPSVTDNRRGDWNLSRIIEEAILSSA